MKKTIIAVLILTISIGLLSGCNKDNGGEATITDKASTNSESIPTLEEVISGTWSLQAGFDQSGNLVYTLPEVSDYSFTFDANGGFTGIYRQGDGYINASFSGTYDVTNSKMVDKNPYKWYYYAKIDKSSIVDSGDSTLIGKLGGEQGLNFIFKFRDLDGEKNLYEDMQRLYFKK